jgi:hypothetical protein
LEQVLCNDGKDFFIDAVELIEATERASSCKTFEVALDEEMVHTVRAVKDNTILSQSLGEIFSGFGLTCSGRTSWSSTEIELQGSHESHIALICQWSDHEATSVSQVFVTVWEASNDTLNPGLIYFVFIRFPVVPELHDPFESVHFRDLVFD